MEAGQGFNLQSIMRQTSTPPGQTGRRREREASADAAEDDTAHNKRQRTALACESCRNRKSRCDGGKPVCTACGAMGFACVYRRPVGSSATQLPASDTSRMSQMENRLHMIEALLHQISRSTDGQCDVGADMSNGMAHIVPSPPPAAEADSVDGMGTITFAGEAVSNYFGLSSNSAFAAQISRAVKATHFAPPAVQPPVANTSLRDNHRNVGVSVATSGQTGSTLSTITLSRPASPFGRQPRKTADLLHLPQRDEMRRLVQAYFAHAGGYFPFVDKTAIVRFVQQVNLSVVSNTRRPFLCLVNAVLACGMSLTLPDSHEVQVDEAQAAVYFEKAYALSPWVTSNTANLETVQSLAVMVQYAEGTSCSAQTWRLHGLLMQAAYNIGLHVEDGTMALEITPLEREMRRRTWYMCLVLDRMLSSTLGRPPLLLEAVAQVPQPSEGEALDHTSPSQPLSQVMGQNPSFRELFVESIQLFHLLGDVISELYHQNRAPQQHLSLEGLLTGVIKLDKRFHDWQNRLSPNLKVVRADDRAILSQDSGGGGRVVLTLRYLSALLLLYRGILTAYLAHVANGTRPDQPPSVHAVCQSYIKVCADLAKEIIDLIADAKATGTAMPSWWFVLYYLFQAALVVFGTVVFSNSSIADYDICRFDVVAQLQKAKRIVEDVAKDTILARRCSKYLAAVIQAVQTLHTSTSQPDTTGFTDYVAGVSSQDFPGNHAAFGSLSNFDLDGGLFFGDSNLQFLNNLGSATETAGY